MKAKMAWSELALLSRAQEGGDGEVGSGKDSNNP